MTVKQKYTGHLLIANPGNPKDELEKSVMLIVTHTDTVGVALQINNPHEDLSLSRISENIGIDHEGDEPIYYGGNVSQNKIHVIHSLDWSGLSTVSLTKDLGITNDISVLAAISKNVGPRYFRACSGYRLWENGMLDEQLNPRANDANIRHYWEIAPATISNVFKTDPSRQWDRAIEEAVKHRTSALFT